MGDHSDIDHTGLTGVGGSVATDAIWDAAGDLAVGSGANTAAKLTKGSDGDVLTVTAGAVGWAAPAAGAASGLLGVKKVKAGTNVASYTTTSTSDVDVDSTNLAITFTAPASGAVIVRLSALCAMSAAGNVTHWTVRESTSTVEDATRVTEATEFVRRHVTFYIDSISAGSHTYKWGWYRDAGSGTCNIYTGPAYGQAVMEIWSA